MYKEHSVCVQPENEDIKVWRYMDFTKLVSLIDSRCLYFTRADKFDDPFEGSWPKMNVMARFDDIPEEHREGILELSKAFGEIFKEWRRYTAINCWHMNEHESAAMWKLYLDSDKGIAIQSTYNNLKRSLIDKEVIYLGVVKYIDYETEFIGVKSHENIIQPFYYKRKSYEHENEVRALLVKWPIPKKGKKVDLPKETMKDGVKIRVDIKTLIEKVYVAPSSPSWFADLVKNVIKRYGYNFKVQHSRLSERPLF